MACISLVGCGSDENIEAPVVDVIAETAVLDTESGTVVLPIDIYSFTVDEGRRVRHANDLLIDSCMRQSGHRYLIPGVTRLALETFDENRTFGRWSRALALAYGDKNPPMPLTESFAAGPPEAEDDEWQAVFADCNQSSPVIDLPPAEGSQATSYAAKGRHTAMMWAMADSRAADTIGAWRACASQAGLPLVVGDLQPVVDTAGLSPEESQRAILAGIDCTEQTGMIQRVFDVVAAYQNAYISAHEAALVEERDLIEGLISQAETIIAEQR